MELESVRSLKGQLLAQGLTRRVVTRRDLPTRAAVVASAVPAALPPPPIALGIEGGQGDFKLAVRITAISQGFRRALTRSRLPRMARCRSGRWDGWSSSS